MRILSILTLVVGLRVLLVTPLQRVDILGKVLSGPALDFAFAMIVTALACRLIRERLAVLGWARPLHLAYGMLLGAAVPIIILFTGTACHVVAMTHAFTMPMGLGLLMVAFAFVALGEEILWRGLVFRLLARQWGFGLAAIVSSAAFAGMHLLSPGETPGVFGWLNLLLLGGVLCLLYRHSNTLWLPVGFHFSWNLVQTVLWALFSSTGSHLTLSAYFGVEGWPLTTIVLAILTVGLLPWRAIRSAQTRELLHGIRSRVK